MSTPPTILLITADQLNCAALSCYGATSHRTPNLDALAARGTLFDAAYATSPFCLPSRCSMMTGLYPHNNRSFSNNTGRSLDLNLPNLFTVLKSAGYHTSLHGKGHYVPVPYAYNARDYTREYEHFMLYYRALGIQHLDLMDDPQVSAWYYDDYAKELERQGLLGGFRDCVWECRHRSEAFPTPGVFAFPGPDAMTPDSWVGEKTLAHLNQCPKDQPAFIWASFGGPHYPTCAPADYYDRIDMDSDQPQQMRDCEWDDFSKFHWKDDWGGNADGDLYTPEGSQKAFDATYWRNWRHGYYASVLHIDDYVGRIVHAAEAKWGDNLLIVFTADHGDMMGDHGFWGKSMLQQGIRVPMIIRWPGGSRAAPTSSSGVQLIDLLPTFAKVAGVPTPPIDGIPIQDSMKSAGRSLLLAESENSFMLFNHKIKYTERLRRDGHLCREVYDLESDPLEFENRYEEGLDLEGYRELTAIRSRLDRDEKLTSTLFFQPGSGGTPPWVKL